MSRNRRDRRKNRGQVIFVTARVYKGIPFVPRETIKRVLLGILARAQGLHRVEICAYVVMGNHYHMILTGQSCHFSPFMNYVQGEIAKAIQRLIPRFYGKSVWESRFKEQVLVTAEDIISKMAYIYLNPVRARCINKAIEYPGLNSYKDLNKGKFSILSKWIPSRKLQSLPNYHNRKEDIELCRKFLVSAQTIEELTVNPFAWFSSYNYKLTKEQFVAKLVARVEQGEQEYNSSVIGVKKLIEQRLRIEFTPNSKTRTPYIICEDKKIRLSEILSYKQFCQACNYAWNSLKRGVSCLWPYGAYRPRMRWGPIPIN